VEFEYYIHSEFECYKVTAGFEYYIIS